MSLEIMLAGAGGAIQVEYSETESVLRTGSGTLNPPAGAKAMRVAVVGAGGGGDGYSDYPNDYKAGGGGGGCAASKIVPAAPVSYNIGEGGVGTWGNPEATNGGYSTASFPDYWMVAYGGKAPPNSPTPTSYGSGGNATGGDYNFSGGRGGWNDSEDNSVYVSGGGAAGPHGNGNGSYSSEGWGDGGGGGGDSNATERYYSGGGPGRDAFYTSATDYDRAGSPWGSTTGGGGGGRYAGGHDGSNGGILVEWFF